MSSAPASGTNGTLGTPDPLAGLRPGHVPFSPYGYIPTESVCIGFIVLFALSTAAHVAQAVRSRLWWLLITAVLAGVGETIGWGARFWSSRDPTAIDPYLMQITTTIIAPTPLIAANFIILARIIQTLGEQYSRLRPLWYSLIFLTCDIVALVVQAVGGAQASIALNSGDDPEKGGRVMLGGIAFQLAAFIIYTMLATEFVARYVFDRPLRGATVAEKRAGMPSKLKLMVLALGLDGLFIVIRSIYRTIELSDGWTGRIIRTQVYFNVLDGAMIVLAMVTLNVLHPRHLLPDGRQSRKESPARSDYADERQNGAFELVAQPGSS